MHHFAEEWIGLLPFCMQVSGASPQEICEPRVISEARSRNLWPILYPCLADGGGVSITRRSGLPEDAY